MQCALRQKEADMESERQRASDALQQASSEAVAEHERIQAQLSDSQSLIAELEGKIARAASSLKAADDLKEAK